jgi:hypothetical protein
MKMHGKHSIKFGKKIKGNPLIQVLGAYGQITLK